jgi:hypothetical protein
VKYYVPGTNYIIKDFVDNMKILRSADLSSWPNGEGLKRELGYASPKKGQVIRAWTYTTLHYNMMHWHSRADRAALGSGSAEEAVLLPKAQPE